MTVQPISKALGAKREPFVPSEIVTSATLIADLKELFGDLDEARSNTDLRARELVEAEYAHEIAYATARVTLEGSEGSVGFKDAKAQQAAAEKKRELGYAKEALKSARRAEEVVSQKLSALQSVAATAREEMRLAGRLDPTERS